jgi:TRAP-type C4-dicarboxylate transport system substrate-binding protein
VNWDLGFAQVTKYIFMGPPGNMSLYQPVDLMDLTVNLGAWRRLSPSMQTFIQEQVQTYSLHHFVTIQRRNVEAMEKFRQAGSSVSRMPLEDVRKLREAAIPIWFKWAKKDADASRIFKFHLDFMSNELLGYLSPEDLKGHSL